MFDWAWDRIAVLDIISYTLAQAMVARVSPKMLKHWLPWQKKTMYRQMYYML